MKTVKTLLKNCVAIANQTTYDLKGIDKLTEEQQSRIAELTVILQNDLSEMRDILDKYNLTYP